MGHGGQIRMKVQRCLQTKPGISTGRGTGSLRDVLGIQTSFTVVTHGVVVEVVTHG